MWVDCGISGRSQRPGVLCGLPAKTAAGIRTKVAYRHVPHDALPLRSDPLRRVELRGPHDVVLPLLQVRTPEALTGINARTRLRHPRSSPRLLIVSPPSRLSRSLILRSTSLCTARCSLRIDPPMRLCVNYSRHPSAAVNV